MDEVLRRWRDRISKLHDDQCNAERGGPHLPIALHEIGRALKLLDDPARDESELSNCLKRIIVFAEVGGYFEFSSSDAKT